MKPIKGEKQIDMNSIKPKLCPFLCAHLATQYDGAIQNTVKKKINSVIIYLFYI